MSDHVNHKINRGLAWVGMAASVVAVLDIIGTLLILRFWVTQGEYGIATAVVSMFGALELASELGLAAAVVARRGHSQAQLSTLFWLNLILGVTMFVGLWIGAPYFARLHGAPVMTNLVRVFGLMLVLRTGYATHQALLKRDLRFKELSLVRVVANLAEFTTKLTAAACGLGVWCFVLGPLARQAVSAVGLPIYYRWWPSLQFKFSDVIDDVKFGLRSSGGEVLYQVYSNLDYQIVSYYFGTAALGLYRAAYELVLEPVRFISGVVTGVAFPAFANVRDNSAAVVDLFIRFCRQNLMVVLSFVAVLVVTASDALHVLIGSAYTEAGHAARVLSVVAVLRSLSHLGPPVFDGLGRPSLTLRYQIVAAVTLTSMFWIFAVTLGDKVGYNSVAVAWAVGYPVAFAVLVVQVFSLIDLRVGDFLKSISDIVLVVAVALVVGIALQIALSSLIAVERFIVVAGTMALIQLGWFGVILRKRQRHAATLATSSK
jgi:O-antigen/teichoic acid export membrane protein